MVLMKGGRWVFGGDEDLEGERISEFLEELSTVATRGCRDGEREEARAAVGGEVGEEELLGVYRLV